MVGLAYVERFVCCAGVALEAHTWMRVVAAAWLLAAKMWDDDCLENPEFADAFCLDADDLCRLEAAFTAVVGYNLALSPSEYARYYFALRSICQLESSSFPLRCLDDDLEQKLNARASEHAANVGGGRSGHARGGHATDARRAAMDDRDLRRSF